MGYIYIIKNSINDKVYIGQTIQSIESRWKQHLRCAKHGNMLTSKLYKNMYEIGIENFYCTQLVECSDNRLDELEIYYIDKYNSYINGYNSTTGGKQYRKGLIYKEPEYLSDVLDDYQKGMSWYSIAAKYSKSIGHIEKLLNINNATRNYSGVTIRAQDEILSMKYIEELKDIIMYDKEFKPEKTFGSMSDVLNFILNDISDCNRNKIYNIKYRIVLAIFNNGIAYGHRWQLYSNLVVGNKIFLTNIDRKAFESGSKAYQPEGKGYWIVDGAIDAFLEAKRTKYVCPLCNKEIDHKARMCSECYKKSLRDKSPIKELYDKDTLEYMLNKYGYNYSAIGRVYGVSSKAVEKVAKKLGLYKPKIEKVINSRNSMIYCVELGVEFKTFKDAASYLIETGRTKSKNTRNIAYHISNSTQTSKRYLGLTWVIQ